MRIPSGKIDQWAYFVAVDATDLKTRKTGLTGFSVLRERNGLNRAFYTTPTVVELDSVNCPGAYRLLIDEDTTIASTSDSEEYLVHIACTGMSPVDRVIELYRRDTTSGQTLTVTSGGIASSNILFVNGVAAGTTTAQLGVNVVNAGGTAWNSGAITNSTFANGAISALKFASNALDAVWSTATRVLTAGTNISLAKGTGVTGFNDLDASGVRGALGMAAANLDTQFAALSGNGTTINNNVLAVNNNVLAVNTKLGAPAGVSVSADIAAVKSDTGAIKGKTDNLPAAPAAVSDVPTAAANAAALLDGAAGVENGMTVRQALRLFAAALLGKANGLATSTVKFRDTNDTKDRISAQVDADGNRYSVTLDPS